MYKTQLHAQRATRLEYTKYTSPRITHPELGGLHPKI